LKKFSRLLPNNLQFIIILTTIEQKLSGFGKYPSAICNVARPAAIKDIKEAINSGTMVARGLGRSYGDASLNEHLVCESVLLNKYINFDENTGILRCEAGVSIEHILESFVNRGWFPPVTPGTKYVTIGGAIASDIHGKNHHKEGAFSNFVNNFKIVIASGDIIECSRENNEDLFWATIGGMGLTGFIIEAEIKLKKIETPFIQNKTIRGKTLAELFDNFEKYDDDYIYSVAWMDIVASGAGQGRNALFLGSHLTKDAQEKSPGIKLNGAKSSKKISVPIEMPSFALNKLSVKAFNSLVYLKNSSVENIQYYESYFYPLDSILNWNNIYGKRGLVQYQLVVPAEKGKESIEKILKKVVEFGGGSFLAVLKKMGKQQGILSFPIEGYTLSMDFAMKKGLIEMCHELDKIVLDYGGRTYLTKDSILTEETFKKMYNGYWQKWMDIKMKYDPQNKFTSILAGRIGLSHY